MNQSDGPGSVGQSADLRTRIAAALQNHRQGQVGGGWLTCSCDEHWSRFSSAVYDGHVADAVIRELDGEFLDFALWLSEEITGKPLSRIDAESCLKDWKDSQ